MDKALSRLGPHLLRMSDGETGARTGWVQPTIEWLRADPDVELIRDGNWTSYEDTPQFKVRDGHTFEPDNIHLSYTDWFHDSYEGFKTLKQRHGFPDIRFQVGMPAAPDMGMMTFGFEEGRADESLGRAFGTAMVREIETIHAEAGDDVVFQLEAPPSTVGVTMVPPQAQEQVAKGIATALNRVAANSPEGAHFGYHLCLGDMEHEAMGESTSALPLVLLTNAIVETFPEGRTLDYVHAPFAASNKPGSLDKAWYEPLTDLVIPDDVRFAPGFVHELSEIEDLKRMLAMVEDLAGREVDISTACGIGRMPSDDQAWAAVDKMVALLKS